MGNERMCGGVLDFALGYGISIYGVRITSCMSD